MGDVTGDVVVVGAGPAGLVLARLLQRAGSRSRCSNAGRGPEAPATDTSADWPEERIREELARRLGIHGKLDGVPLGEPTVVELRVRVDDPMQDGRLFLAGDAAHLITSAAGKGMNLAIQDAVELAAGLVDRFGPARDGRRLAAYSATRLPAIWRTEAFSMWYLRVLFSGFRNGTEPAVAVPGGFTNGVREGWLTALLGDLLLARWFAHAYARVGSGSVIADDH